MSLAIAAFAPPAPSSTKATSAAPDGDGADFAQTLSEHTDRADPAAAAHTKKASAATAQNGPATEDATAVAAPAPAISTATVSAETPAEAASDPTGEETTDAEAATPAEVTTADAQQPVVVTPPASAFPMSPDGLDAQPSTPEAGVGPGVADPLQAATLPPSEPLPAFSQQENQAAAGRPDAAPVLSPTTPAREATPSASPTAASPSTASSTPPTEPLAQAQGQGADPSGSRSAQVAGSGVAVKSAEPGAVGDAPAQSAPVVAPVLASGSRAEASASNAAQPGDAPSTSATPNGDAAPKLKLAEAATAQSGATAGVGTPPTSDAATAQAAPAEPAAPAPATTAPAPAPAQQVSAPAFPLGLMSTLSQATIETTTRIAAQIAARLEGRSTRFDMVLTPEDLGRVEVSLEIDETGQLAARLAFDNPAAATDLRGRADELRRQLQDAGFQVAGDGLDFSHREDARGGENGGGLFDRRGRSSLFSGASRLAAEADIAAAPPPGAWINLSLARERVDLKV